MDKVQGVHVMQRRLPFSFWLPMGTLLSVALWYGCEQKGDLSPVSSARDNLAFIDTIIIDPPVISPLGTAWIEARVVNEQQEPAAGEDVRFTATRGTFGEDGPDVTIPADNYGVARTLYTAPADTGNVSLHIELVSMQTAQSRSLPVQVGAGSQDGLLSVSADEDTLFADNGASTTQVRARVRNALNNPIGGAEVTFSTSRGVITSPSVTDA
ncbi:MAG: Ig-like domain-containing protein [bacterium]|nr:Ig-like domain-containing protein [bacterium]